MRLNPRRIALCALAALAFACAEPPAPTPAVEVAPPPPPPPPLEPEKTVTIRSGQIERNDTTAGALGRVGVSIATTNEIVAAFDGVFDFRKARPGDEFRVEFDEAGVVDYFEFRRGVVDEYFAVREEGKLVAQKREFQLEKEIIKISATLESSLYEAILAQGEDPVVAVSMAEVLAWDIDFYNDPRKGDQFTLMVEKFSHEGRRVRYGELLAAEYDGQLVGKKRVFRYDNPRSGQIEYYAEDGSAARRAFLKSPLKFGHVTSRFGMRFHPVLKYAKAHQGVDYGAPTGTPIWSVGDGTVVRAGWAGACGKMVEIRHPNHLNSVYCHLSRIASEVRPGARVQQKQVIGYVGTTGRSTGPHLHYAVKRAGRFVNPLTLKFPPAAPIPAEQMEDFQLAIAPLVSELGITAVADAAPADVAPTEVTQ